jgi:hypothetical protein
LHIFILDYQLSPSYLNQYVYLHMSHPAHFFFFILLLCWVAVHCGIDKSSYNISYLNSPSLPFSFIFLPFLENFQQVPFFHLHTCVHSICTIYTFPPNWFHFFPLYTLFFMLLKIFMLSFLHLLTCAHYLSHLPSWSLKWN